MDDSKMEWLNEGIVNLAGIDIMSVIIITVLVIYVLSLNMLFDISEKYKNVTNKTQSLERHANEIKNSIPHTQRNLEQKLLNHCIMKLKRSGPQLLENQH